MTDGYLDFEEMLREESLKEDALLPEIPIEMPIVPSKIDTRPVLADLKAMEAKGTDLVNKANALTIKTAKDNENAVNISGKLQEIAKQVKKKCEDYLEPYKKVTASVNAPKKRITEAVTKAKTVINQKIFQYKKKEEIDRARQQKKIDDASKALQEDLNEQAKELGVEAPKVAPIKAPAPTMVLRGSSGSSVYMRKTWKCEIVDPDKVERQYCVASQTLLNQAVKMGKRDLAGCKIYEDETPVTRTG